MVAVLNTFLGAILLLTLRAQNIDPKSTYAVT